MKIVISGYIGKKITGIGRNLTSLLNAVDSDTKFVIYVNEDMRDDFCFTNKNVLVKTYKVSKNSSMKNLLWTTFVFPFKALTENADRALIPNFTLLLFKFKSTDVIMHDLIEYNVPNKFSKLKMFYRTKLANPITAKRADKIITISECSKRDIKKFLGVKDKKITIVKCGVDQEKFSKMPLEKATSIFEAKGWPKNYMLYVGTVDHPGKNSMSVIKAFEKLKKSGAYDGKLILAGMPGAGFEAIDDYVKKSEYKNDILITGFVTDDELVALYSYCKVFCFVSFYEGFGIPPLEALSCGAKVVVSNTSSLPEVVGDIGITVNPANLKEITEGIKKALNTDVDEEYKAKVRKHLNNYRWDKLGKEFDEALCKPSVKR